MSLSPPSDRKRHMEMIGEWVAGKKSPVAGAKVGESNAEDVEKDGMIDPRVSVAGAKRADQFEAVLTQGFRLQERNGQTNLRLY
jgi:hypothetical protein